MAYEKFVNAALCLLIIVGTLFFLTAINHSIALHYANKFCSLRGYIEVITGPKLNLYSKRLEDGSDDLLLVPYDDRKENN